VIKVKTKIIDLDPNNQIQISDFKRMFIQYNIDIKSKNTFEELEKISNDFIIMIANNETRWISLMINEENSFVGFVIYQITDFDVNTYMYDGRAKLEHGFPKWMFLREHFVTQKYRKNGYGRKLSEYVVEKARLYLVNEIYLTADDAIAFWEKMGYQKLNKMGFNGLDVLKLEI